MASFNIVRIREPRNFLTESVCGCDLDRIPHVLEKFCREAESLRNAFYKFPCLLPCTVAPHRKFSKDSGDYIRARRTELGIIRGPVIDALAWHSWFRGFIGVL